MITVKKQQALLKQLERQIAALHKKEEMAHQHLHVALLKAKKVARILKKVSPKQSVRAKSKTKK